jgi:hypothetical protein
VAEIALSNQSFFLTSCCRKALGMKRFEVALATGFGLTLRVLGCYIDIIARIYTNATCINYYLTTLVKKSVSVALFACYIPVPLSC